MFPFDRLFGAPSLRPDWTYTPGGIIWRVLVSSKGFIAGETRTEATKTVEFFCLREQDGTLAWKPHPLHELWWMGIEGIHGDLLVVHGYTQPDLPEHRGVYALSLETGEQIWQASDVTYWFGTEDRIYGVKAVFDRRIGVEIDLQSGALIREHRESLDEIIALRNRLPAQDEDFRYPAPLDEGILSIAVKQQLERTRRRYEVVGDPEGFLVRDRFLCNMYTKNDAPSGSPMLLSNRLFVLDEARGKLLHADVLDSSARFPVPDTFFLKNERLYYVKAGKTLKSISLWK